jgi:hypothetical protein
MKLLMAGVLAVTALGGPLASWGSAAEWHTNGPLAASTTNAGLGRFIFHPHSGAASTSFQCVVSSMDITFNGPTSRAFPWTNAATLTPTFTGCATGGGAGFVVGCSTAELRAISYVGGTNFPTAGDGITAAQVANINCTLSVGVNRCVTVTGAVNAHFTNPGVAGGPPTSGAARLTITAANQQLTADQIAPGCALLPAGRVTFGSASGTSVGNLTYVIDGPNAPYIYRTP